MQSVHPQQPEGPCRVPHTVCPPRCTQSSPTANPGPQITAPGQPAAHRPPCRLQSLQGLSHHALQHPSGRWPASLLPLVPCLPGRGSSACSYCADFQGASLHGHARQLVLPPVNPNGCLRLSFPAAAVGQLSQCNTVGSCMGCSACREPAAPRPYLLQARHRLAEQGLDGRADCQCRGAAHDQHRKLLHQGVRTHPSQLVALLQQRLHRLPVSQACSAQHSADIRRAAGGWKLLSAAAAAGMVDCACGRLTAAAAQDQRAIHQPPPAQARRASRACPSAAHGAHGRPNMAAAHCRQPRQSAQRGSQQRPAATQL